MVYIITFFENEMKLKCVRTTVTNQNYIREEIESIKFVEGLIPVSSESFSFPFPV
jgi:hypothetical protein